ncbi:hypothetical protein KIF59_00545 [Enterobacter cloacae subsp. cloacae]|nr:hypothetical protein [Enterobacter cloacae subsp. cloacae]
MSRCTLPLTGVGCIRRVKPTAVSPAEIKDGASILNTPLSASGTLISRRKTRRKPSATTFA